MKKYLLPIPIAVLLSSCGKTTHISSQESKETIESSTVTITSEVEDSSNEVLSSNEEIVSSSEEQSSASEELSLSDISSSSTEKPLSILKKTLTFYNGGFTGSLDLPGTMDSFINWCNQDTPIINSIGCVGYAQLNYIGNQNDENRFSTLILGSQSQTGKLIFNLAVTAIHVRVNVQPYTKYIAYNNSYNVDTHAVIYINDVEHDLYLEDGYNGPTDSRDFEYGNTDGMGTITIANKENNQRVFVHSVEITYWG